jgi:hypothetical protein
VLHITFTRCLCWDLTTWDQAGPLGDCSPRLCQLRINGLTPVSKYWMYWSHVGDMVPVNLVAVHQQKIGFTSTASIVVLGEKLGTEPQTDQLAWCGLCREPFFSGAVALLNSVDDYAKGCYALTMFDTYGLGPYAGWAWDAYGVLVRFPLQGVHWYKSPRLSNMSHCLFVSVST